MGRRGQGDGLRGGVRASAGDSGNASNLEAAFKNMTLFKDRHCPLTCVLTESCFISVPLTSEATLPRRTESRGNPGEMEEESGHLTEMPPTSPRATGIGQAGLPHRRGSPTSSQDSGTRRPTLDPATSRPGVHPPVRPGHPLCARLSCVGDGGGPELQAGQRGTFTDPPFNASLLVSLKSPFSPNHRVDVKPGCGGSMPAPGAPYPPVSVQECDWQRGPGGI